MRSKLVIVGTVLIASLLSIRATWSQGPARSPDDEFVPRPVGRSYSSLPKAAPHAVDGFIMEKKGRLRRNVSGDSELNARLREAQDLANELKLANEPDSKADATKKAELAKKLEAAVAAAFDADLKDREQRLTALEQQLKNLRSSLDRRRYAKAEIVQLEVKVLANEAAGLGFSTRGDFGWDGTGPQNPRFQRWWRDEAP